MNRKRSQIIIQDVSNHVLKRFGVFKGETLTHQFTNKQFTNMKTQIKKIIIACLTFITFMSIGQTEPTRVSFTVTNSSMKAKTIEFRSYNNELHKRTAGYGYGLNAFGSHAVNLPVPVRVYEEKNGKYKLLFVVTENDNGRTFSVNKDYKVTPEQYLQASKDEANEQKEILEKAKENKTVEYIAKERGLKLVNVTVKGSSWFPSMAHVRYELPWGKDNQLGFSSTLSKFNGRDIALPIGTKIYQCSDKYWDKNTKFTEKLILTVDDKKSDITVVLN